MGVINQQSKQSRLWIALRFPELPLNALGFIGDISQAVATIEKQKVVCASTPAQQAGVNVGMDVTTATLLCRCEIQIRDDKREVTLLKELSEQLYRFTPYIETYIASTVPQSGFLLEISTCLNLFAGLKALVARITDFLTTTRYRFELGLAHTAKGAWLLSFARYNVTGEEDKPEFCERLKSLPVQLLHDHPKTIEALEKTGFHTLGDIARQIDAQSISGIKKRFGQRFAADISDIFGIDHHLQQGALFDKPVESYKPREFFTDTVELGFPTNNTKLLEWPIETLLQNLTNYLRQRQLECQHIEWMLSDINHQQEAINVYCDNAQSHWQLLYDLTLIQLENRELSFEVDRLTLTCPNANPLQNRNQLLAFDNSRKHAGRAQNLAITIAKLKARLGENAVYKISYCDRLLPEACSVSIPLNQPCEQNIPAAHKVKLRPTWLYPSPLLIEERQKGLYWRGYLRLIAGPERIHGEWWNTSSGRDYFLATRHDHVRFWIYEDLYDKRWYVHGIFG